MGRKSGSRRRRPSRARGAAGGGAGGEEPKLVGSAAEAEAGLNGEMFGPSPAPVRYLGGSAGKAESKEAISRIFGREVPDQELASLTGAPTGSAVSVRQGYGGSVELRVDHPDIQSAVRTISRNGDGDLVMHNDIFKTKVSGTGFGSEMVGRQMEQAAKLGIKKVETNAARWDAEDGYVGYKVWPKFGYDGNIPFGPRNALRSSNLPAAQKNATRVSELYKTKEGQAWWEKHGDSTDMTFDLTPGSYSRRTMAAYQARRRAR